MGIIVQKFGGTSVATPERIHKAAGKVLAAKEGGASGGGGRFGDGPYDG